MELKKLELPSGAIAYVKQELTAGDYDDVMGVFLDSTDMEIDANEVDEEKRLKVVKRMSNSQIFTKAKYKLIEVLVKKIEIKNESDGLISVTVEPVTEEVARSMSIADINFLKEETEAIKKIASLSVEERKKS